MTSMLTHGALGALAGVTLMAGTAIAQDYNPDTLRVALLPDENAATVIQNNKPLQDYLEQQLDKDIELVVTTDYSSMVEAMRFGRLELAYFGPVSYTLAKENMGQSDFDIEPFAALMEDGAATYESVLIANADTDIQNVEDLSNVEDLQVAYGDVASTSSHFAPKSMLQDAGYQAGENYQENFTGAHDAVAKNVEAGNAQIGGLSRPIFESLLERGLIDESKVRVLRYSEPLPQYPWVLRTDLTPELKEKIKNAFWSLDAAKESDAEVLDPFGADGFAEINDSDYDVIRRLRSEVMG